MKKSQSSLKNRIMDREWSWKVLNAMLEIKEKYRDEPEKILVSYRDNLDKIVLAFAGIVDKNERVRFLEWAEKMIS